MTTLMTNRSSRFRGVTTLRGVQLNVDGDQAENFQLPVGFGDCLLQAVHVNVSDAATLVTAWETLGANALLVNPNGDVLVGVGSEYWRKGTATSLACKIWLPFPMIWYSTEELRLVYSEVDTNVAPTADVVVTAEVIRLRS